MRVLDLMLEFSLVSYMSLRNVIRNISLIKAFMLRILFSTIVFGKIRLVLMLMLTNIFTFMFILMPVGMRVMVVKRMMDIMLMEGNRLNIMLVVVRVIERVMSAMIHMILNIVVVLTTMVNNWSMEMGIFMKHLLMG